MFTTVAAIVIYVCSCLVPTKYPSTSTFLENPTKHHCTELIHGTVL